MYRFHTSGLGIGDAISAYYVACGLAEASEAEVEYCSRHDLAWFSAVEHPGVQLRPYIEGQDNGPDCNLDYWGQLQAAAMRICPSRGQWLCNNLSRAFQIPLFAPARPRSVRHPEPVLEPRYAVLAPFSLHQHRIWPLERWKQIATMLVNQGLNVVGIDQPGSGERLQDLLHDIPDARWYWGATPEWIVALLSHAELFVGNDSGMTHLAGLLKTPARAIMTQLTPEFVFSEAPTVLGVDAKGWNCQGCAWQQTGGYRESCNERCDALASIEPERILDAVEHPRSTADLLHIIQQKLGERAASIAWLLEQLQQRFSHPFVLETGCTRSRWDWSAGSFTWLCGAWLHAIQSGELHSVDVDPLNVRIARNLCQPWNRVEIWQADSVRWIQQCDRPISLAYLDSQDTYVPGYAEHALAEAQTVAAKIATRGMIAIDDSPPSETGWTGKGQLAIPWLLARGWRIVDEATRYVVVLERC